MDGYMMRCFNGQRMDFELVADHQAGMVEFDWFGTYSFSVIGDRILLCENLILTGSRSGVIELDTPKTGITMEMLM